MHYEARVQAVIVYCAEFEKMSVKKPAARDIFLTRDQYLRVPPNWCANKAECWSMMVDKWISEDWARQHALCRERRLMMPGPAHHQGSLSLGEYKNTWSESHPGQSCNDFTAYTMSHMGRATSDVAYNPAAPPEAYTNPSIHAHQCIHGGEKGAPRGDLGSDHHATLRRSHHEGETREEARAVLDRQQLGRHGEYAQSLTA
ncbi:uncharacterized protein LOC120713196 [Panicum virgatum]|uniref:uncharacterized protein LOC120713196 n=1 Tax=Panicum virgatum TaxID=38727 RepID=UPI0019D56A2C|nr:uncharacterized protein LOC120713196 [Panicum virgatum]